MLRPRTRVRSTRIAGLARWYAAARIGQARRCMQRAFARGSRACGVPGGCA